MRINGSNDRETMNIIGTNYLFPNKLIRPGNYIKPIQAKLNKYQQFEDIGKILEMVTINHHHISIEIKMIKVYKNRNGWEEVESTYNLDICLKLFLTDTSIHFYYNMFMTYSKNFSICRTVLETIILVAIFSFSCITYLLWFIVHVGRILRAVLSPTLTPGGFVSPSGNSLSYRMRMFPNRSNFRNLL